MGQREDVTPHPCFDRIAILLPTLAMSMRRFASCVHRRLAATALAATHHLNADDFLARRGIPLPVPVVEGAMDVTARRGFSARRVGRPVDLLVCFRVGDWTAGARGSSYFDPQSPWYNVFYGGYGMRSYKRDGSAWGYGPDGQPRVDEVLDVVGLDYDFLTAGELGCPPERMCFGVEDLVLSRRDGWDVLDAVATVPSALHRMREAYRPNWSYYLAFGLPDATLLGEEELSFAPVRMRGRLHVRQAGPRLSIAWGALCPDTFSGQALLRRILSAMEPHYVPAPPAVADEAPLRRTA
jgi:hypothetical protein